MSLVELICSCGHCCAADIWPSIFSSPPEEKDVLGALCLLWWTLTIVTMTKYLFIVLSANDHGEGAPSDMP